jgi:hypothetical protein
MMDQSFYFPQLRSTSLDYREKIRRIANNSYNIRIREDSSPTEEFSQIIQQSNKLFDTIFTTAVAVPSL